MAAGYCSASLTLRVVCSQRVDVGLLVEDSGLVPVALCVLWGSSPGWALERHHLLDSPAVALHICWVRAQRDRHAQLVGAPRIRAGEEKRRWSTYPPVCPRCAPEHPRPRWTSPPWELRGDGTARVTAASSTRTHVTQRVEFHPSRDVGQRKCNATQMRLSDGNLPESAAREENVNTTLCERKATPWQLPAPSHWRF